MEEKKLNYKCESWTELKGADRDAVWLCSTYSVLPLVVFLIFFYHQFHQLCWKKKRERGPKIDLMNRLLKKTEVLRYRRKRLFCSAAQGSDEKKGEMKRSRWMEREAEKTAHRCAAYFMEWSVVRHFVLQWIKKTKKTILATVQSKKNSLSVWLNCVTEKPPLLQLWWLHSCQNTFSQTMLGSFGAERVSGR